MNIIKSLKAALRLPAANFDIDYLNEATSRVDLEMRQREIDRGKFRRSTRLG